MSGHSRTSRRDEQGAIPWGNDEETPVWQIQGGCFGHNPDMEIGRESNGSDTEKIQRPVTQLEPRVFVGQAFRPDRGSVRPESLTYKDLRPGSHRRWF